MEENLRGQGRGFTFICRLQLAPPPYCVHPAHCFYYIMFNNIHRRSPVPKFPRHGTLSGASAASAKQSGWCLLLQRLQETHGFRLRWGSFFSSWLRPSAQDEGTAHPACGSSVVPPLPRPRRIDTGKRFPTLLKPCCAAPTCCEDQMNGDCSSRGSDLIVKKDFGERPLVVPTSGTREFTRPSRTKFSPPRLPLLSCSAVPTLRRQGFPAAILLIWISFSA